MRRKAVFFIALIIILCFVSYYNSLHGAFVFDDIVAVVRNKDVTRSPLSLYSVFNHDFWGANLTDPQSHKSYRPLTILLFHFEYNMLQFGSFHMKSVNLIIHCVNSVLVLQLFRTLTSNSRLSFIGAALFAVHPVHTEAVCGVVGRADLLFCLCYLSAILLMDDIDNKLSNGFKYLGIICLAIVGLLCKESAITILPCCAFYDFIKRQCWKKKIEIHTKAFINGRYISFGLLTVLLLVLRLWIQNFESPIFKAVDNPVAANEDFQTRFVTQNFLYALNCWILLCPIWLSFDWAIGSIQLVSSIADTRVLGILLMYIMGYKIIKTKSKTFLVALGLMVIPFLPASGIIRLGFVIAERVLYVPSVGFCLLVACGFEDVYRRLTKYHRMMHTILIGFIALYILRTQQRAADWMTDERLFSSALSVCPNNAKVHYNIARLATDKGDKNKALSHYHQAIKLYADYESALINLGSVYRDLGDYTTAEIYIKAGLKLVEKYPVAWMNLGTVYALQKKYKLALESYQNALKYRKHYPICYYNMGNLFLELKEYSEAIKHWQESLALNPFQPKAWANILTLLDNQGLYEDAIRLSGQALEYVPNQTSILFIRANVHGKMKQYVEAEKLYKFVIQTEPLNALYHTNMGVLYHRWGKDDLAIKSYENAVRLDPNSRTASDNLSKLLRRRSLEIS